MTYLTFYDDEGEEQRIPARYTLCDRCGGTGSHVNPAVDGNGLTADDFDELGDDFREDYFAGVYDVQCSECHGDRVVLIPDRGQATAEALDAYDAAKQEEYETDAIYAAERAMGA